MIQVTSENDKGGVRSYRTQGDRRRAIKQMWRRGWNYFVCFIEASPKSIAGESQCGLQYGKADWVAPNHAYVNGDVKPHLRAKVRR